MKTVTNTTQKSNCNKFDDEVTLQLAGDGDYMFNSIVSTSNWIISHWDSHWGNTVTDTDAARIDDIADLVGIGFGHDGIVYVPERFEWINGLDNPNVSTAIVRIPPDVSDINTAKRYLDSHCTDYDVTLSPSGNNLYLTSKHKHDGNRIDVDIDYETNLLMFTVFKNGSYK